MSTRGVGARGKVTWPGRPRSCQTAVAASSVDRDDGDDDDARGSAARRRGSGILRHGRPNALYTDGYFCAALAPSRGSFFFSVASRGVAQQ